MAFSTWMGRVGGSSAGRQLSSEFASRKLRDFSTVVFRDYSVKLVFIITNASMTQQGLFMRFTLDSVFKIAFGYVVGTLIGLPAVPFAEAFIITNEITSKRFMNPIWKLQRALNVGNEAVLVSGAKEVDEFIYTVIEYFAFICPVQNIDRHFTNLQTSDVVAMMFTSTSIF